MSYGRLKDKEQALGAEIDDLIGEEQLNPGQSIDDKKQISFAEKALVPGLKRKVIVHWANENLSPDCVVTSEGLGCFAGVTDAGSQHRAIIAGSRKPKSLPEFNWINTI
jgi:hypothetical protein